MGLIEFFTQNPFEYWKWAETQFAIPYTFEVDGKTYTINSGGDLIWLSRKP